LVEVYVCFADTLKCFPLHKDKLVEIAYLNENIAGTAMASSYGGKATPSGNFLPDVMMPGAIDLMSCSPCPSCQELEKQ